MARSQGWMGEGRPQPLPMTQPMARPPAPVWPLWWVALELALALWLGPVGLSAPHNGIQALGQTATAYPAEPIFADVLVRGQPVFQVGGLAEVSAVDRTGQINRRLAALLNQSIDHDPVTVNLGDESSSATLQVNQRAIMTVNERDALDFDTDVAALAQTWATLLNQAMARTNLATAVRYRIQNTAQQFLGNVLDNLPGVLGAIVTIAFTWLLAIGVRHAALVWAEKTEGDRTTAYPLRKSRAMP